MVLASCAKDVVDEGPKKPEVKQDRLVGRVASVYGKEGEGYILIQRYSSLDAAGDKVFYVRSEGELVTSLRLTGERLGQYLAADIVQGAPVVGDPVFERVLESAPTEALGGSEGGLAAEEPVVSPIKPAEE